MVGHYEAHAGGRHDRLNTKTVVDIYRTPHTEKLHVVERWHTIDAGKTLEVTITIEDPDTFYQPWTVRVRGQRGREEFVEEICAESNFNFGLFDFHMPVAKTADF